MSQIAPLPHIVGGLECNDEKTILPRRSASQVGVWVSTLNLVNVDASSIAKILEERHVDAECLDSVSSQVLSNICELPLGVCEQIKSQRNADLSYRVALPKPGDAVCRSEFELPSVGDRDTPNVNVDVCDVQSSDSLGSAFGSLLHDSHIVSTRRAAFFHKFSAPAQKKLSFFVLFLFPAVMLVLPAFFIPLDDPRCGMWDNWVFIFPWTFVVMFAGGTGCCYVCGLWAGVERELVGRPWVVLFSIVLAWFVNDAVVVFAGLLGIFPLPFNLYTAGLLWLNCYPFVVWRYLIVPLEERDDVRAIRTSVMWKTWITLFVGLGMYLAYTGVFFQLKGFPQLLMVPLFPCMKFVYKKSMGMFTQQRPQTRQELAPFHHFHIQYLHGLFQSFLFARADTLIAVLLLAIFDLIGILVSFSRLMDVGYSLVSKPNQSSLSRPSVKPEQIRRRSTLGIEMFRSTVLEASHPVVYDVNDIDVAYRRKLHLAEVLVVEEFVECVAALQFGLILPLIFFGSNRSFFYTLEDITSAEFGLALAYVGLNFLAEAVFFFLATHVVYRAFRIDMLKLLCFTFSSWEKWVVAQTVMSAVNACMVWLTIKHMGHDFSLRFEWI